MTQCLPVNIRPLCSAPGQKVTHGCLHPQLLQEGGLFGRLRILQKEKALIIDVCRRPTRTQVLALAHIMFDVN
jgi:hypothetical protein